MKTTYKLKGLVAAVIIILSFSSCSSEDALLEDLLVKREFAPIDLQSFVRNQTNIELNWVTEETVAFYVADVSTDPDFAAIDATRNVNASELPILIPLTGETLYYIRVKAVSARGLEDSKYATTTAQTLTEQIFLPIEPGDIQATEALLRWLPNSEVTEFVINPGSITRTITPQEKADGIATITGLTGETDYTVMLMNNTVIRGIQNFTTGIDIGTGTLILPTDDLFQMIADADPGAVLVLEAGDYTSQIGTISLNKSLTIRGLRSFDKPLLKVNFSIGTGATDVSLIDLDLTGDLPTELFDVVRFTEPGSYNSLLISGCNIHDYNRSFVAGNTTGATVNSLEIDDCKVTNVITNGGDFIDFRNTNALNISITNSTFNKCAPIPGRDFLRVDAAGDLNGSATVNILLESCTLYACADSNSRRIFYVRFNANEITSRNNLITDTAVEAYSDNSATDETIDFANNNYFNAPTLYDESVPRFDNSTNYLTLDPGYANAPAGDFSVSNQTIIDNAIGDPRWLQ